MDFSIPNPFVEMLGFALVSAEAGHARLTATPRAELLNSWGVLHGGVTMTLLDVAMANAARSPGQAGPPETRGVVTVEMKTSFMRPGIGALRADGRVLHRTASMAFCEATVVDAEGVIVAHATGTFKFLKGLPAGGSKIQRLHASD